MDYDLAAWLNLALRWLHVIAGVAWIGASFYFVWLDNNLRAPESLDGRPPKDGVKGELWAVHGGGFYHSQKYMTAPAHMPSHLHWFKWEAYTTWLSGFALLFVLYYWGAPVYLIDPAKHAFSHWQAVGVGLAFIFGGLAVYEALCRSPLVERPRLFGIVWFCALIGAAWTLQHLFTDRGAFIHVGAIIGTAMAANVFLTIIPNQRKIVADMLAGRPVDPRLGAAGKQRSVHNNYMTLPILFIMISNHYPAITGHPLAWLLLALVGMAGISIRHFFNLRHHGIIRHDFLFYGAMLMFAVSVIASQKPKAPAVLGPVSFFEAQAIVEKHCVTCHAAKPTHRGFGAPPNGVTFDSPEHIARYAPKIKERAVISTSMPLGNETHMTDEERAKLGAWIESGAKLP
ncbi:urate hydroxylase PuuD [Caulobacter sp. 602-2]|uniref:Urate hydroxylase PuuD n=1 Tax=Caulobacter sp. 602-2 TaxID=2710887 RepID=A0A6G4QW02_9CAUL|nr:urate hydroxylase PuuD [Caulobacter sp. 602-2]NGM49128.1 urate hydroxylase PuuD [Caulobacter sp. 602-2]